MKKGLTLATMFILIFSFTFAQKATKAPKEPKAPKESKEDAKKKKEEEKKIKDELKAYMKNPATYKAKMDEIQANKDSADARISRLTADLSAAQEQQAELQKKSTADDDQIKQLQDENTQVKETVAKEKENDMKGTPPSGTVYKVQLGIYNGFKVNKDFDQARYIGYEDVNGMNRYVISYFPDSLAAAQFVGDIRKLGIRDAFVAKYIDGQRVYEWNLNPKYRGKKVPDSLEDALNGNKPAKRAKKANSAE
jgi:hypothetical protein